MSLQLFAASSASRRSSSPPSTASSWSKISGKSDGGDAKRAGLFIAGANERYCLGLIGKGQLLVCAKPEKECDTTHRGGKLETSKGLHELVFVRDPALPVRFLVAPVAEREWFSEGSLKVMEHTKKTVPEWAEYFGAAKEAARDHARSADILDIERHLQFVSQAQEFATPAKVAAQQAEEPIESSPLSEGMSLGDAQWKEGSGLLPGVLDHLDKLGEAIVHTMGNLRDSQARELLRYEGIANDFLKVKVWQDDMREKVGRRVSIKGRDFPSLWGALDYGVRSAESELQEAVIKLRRETDSLVKDKLKLDQELVEWKAAVFKGFQDVEEVLDAKFEEIENRLDEVDLKLKSGKPNKKPGRGPAIQDGYLFPRSRGRNNDEDEKAHEDGESEVGEMLCELASRIRRIETSARTHSGGGGDGDGPPVYGNLGLVSPSDMEAWNAENGGVMLFGLFVDAPALLTFKREDFTSVGDQLAGLKRAGDIGLNQIQVKVLASFQNTLPEFFGKGKEVEGSSLPSLPKFEDWEADNGYDGAKYRLERSLPLIQKQLTTHIDIYLGDDRIVARELAHRCLSHSVLFITKLSDYITRTARSLKLAGYKTDKVWTILSRQVRRIFEDMARARAGAADLEPPQDRRGREGALVTDLSASLAMWAILKTHDIMESYIAHNFEDHPSIAAENVRFLTYNLMGAGRSDADTDVKNLEKQVDKIDASKKLMQSMVDKLGARLDKLEKKA